MEVDAILLLGDTLDPATPEELDWLNALIARSEVPIYPIIGNHELYGPVSLEEFHSSLGLPEHGNYLASVKGVPFVMLATPHIDALAPGSPDFAWLESTLSQLPAARNVFCCAHLSLLLHPCVQGWNDDGTQVLRAADDVLPLLRKHPMVRGWIAGHKNVPSKVVHEGVLHLLSPQLIQTPCAFRLLDIHDEGVLSHVHPIEEEDLARWSDRAQGASFQERLGRGEDRDFWWAW
jgi:3',5'-cyclic AMP phosphodiesterase CpdA